MTPPGGIGALILAAGKSRRMGRAKLNLPWNDLTVIGHVVRTLDAAGASEIIAVTGADREAIERALVGLPVRTVHNARYTEDSMILSLQAGIGALSDDTAAFLVALGDQPQIELQVVRRVIERFRSTGAGLVAPSFGGRRGHPWLAARPLWDDLLRRPAHHTGRDFLNDHAAEIEYVEVQSDSILRDLDTPEDYRRERIHSQSDRRE